MNWKQQKFFGKLNAKAKPNHTLNLQLIRIDLTQKNSQESALWIILIYGNRNQKSNPFHLFHLKLFQKTNK